MVKQQQLGVEEVPEQDYKRTRQRLFSFQEQQSRVRVPLDQLLPVNEGMSYAAIVTDMSIRKDGRLQDIRTFDDLWRILSLPGSLENLRWVLCESGSIEGVKRFPKGIRGILISASRSSMVLCRCVQNPDIYYWRASIRDLLEADDLLHAWPHPFGEFEFFDPDGNWFLWTMDDIPFVFLACPEALLARLLTETPSYVMRVPRSFECC